MAIAQDMKIRPQKRIYPHQQWKFLESSAATIHRLWWHTLAYATVLGIMTI
jgi:hypothetical protein